MARFRSTRPTTRRRKRVWAREQGGQFINTTGLGDAFELGTAFQTQLGVTSFPPGTTIGGIKLSYVVRRAAASTAANTGLLVAIGVFDETVPAEVPRPLGSGAHSDWMYMDTVFVGLAAGSSFYTGSGGDGQSIDVRAQRKIEEIGEHLWLVVEPVVAAETWTMAWSSSVLLLMP